MEALQIMPIMAQNQSRFNLGEYAEEAAIIQDEPTVQHVCMMRLAHSMQVKE